MPPFTPPAPMPTPAANIPGTVPTQGNSVGATPTVPGVSEPMTPEHKAELLDLLSKIKQEYMKWRSMSFGIQNQANEFRKDQLKTVFQMLQSKGVNLNDQKSVAEFLNNLKKNAPQHFEAITRALDYLLGSDYETQQQGSNPQGPQGPQDQPAVTPDI